MCARRDHRSLHFTRLSTKFLLGQDLVTFNYKELTNRGRINKYGSLAFPGLLPRGFANALAAKGGKPRCNRGRVGRGGESVTLRALSTPAAPQDGSRVSARSAAFEPGADSRFAASRGRRRPRFGLWVNKRRKKIFVRACVSSSVLPGVRARART